TVSRWLQGFTMTTVAYLPALKPAVIARVLYGVPYVATYGYKYPEFVLLKGRRAFAAFMRVVEWIGARLAYTVIYTTSELRAYLVGRCGSVVVPKLRYFWRSTRSTHHSFCRSFGAAKKSFCPA
ncbi:MAG: hypothetical protein AAB912_02115, partial [Patescibacteria group bacterium]